jgi:hypothetical protein
LFLFFWASKRKEKGISGRALGYNAAGWPMDQTRIKDKKLRQPLAYIIKNQRMDDTPEFIKQKQHEIIMAKSPAERLEMAFEMAEFGRKMVEDRIRRQYPDFNEAQVRAKFVREYYYDCFSEEEFARIEKFILDNYFTYHPTQP